MNMVNMEWSDEERKEMTGGMVAEAPKYPWGLEISLDDDGIEKLKIDPLPKVGDTARITCRVKVVGVSSEAVAGGDDEKRVRLQITDMAIGPDEEPTDHASVLFSSTMKK